MHLIRNLGADEQNLKRYGLTSEEYRAALPAAIETMRGSMSASRGAKKDFLTDIFKQMESSGALSEVKLPAYNEDTVYRLAVPNLGDVAVIQKGCPDGKHSSVEWSTPGWAKETYLWWVCDSKKTEPGGHVHGGINRIRRHKYFSRTPEGIDGVIFHSPLCGTPERICPKRDGGIEIAGREIPVPCIYVMPNWTDDSSELNWDGSQSRKFPAVLLGFFGVSQENVAAHTGYVGFRRQGGKIRTTITARYGNGCSTTYRS